MIVPETLEQLCAAVRRAGETGCALAPRSSGAPHIHGASDNPVAETVSFEKMDRILKIDRENRYARVEAGVSFGSLLPKLAERGLRANHPFLPRANKSVAASMLEREAVLVPKYQYDYTDPLLTAEVVYGTGEVFRTGSAAGPGPAEELKADMVCPWGPGSIDFLRFLCGAQGTMGLVTWATLKAEVLPTASVLFFIESDCLEALTDLAARLLLHRVPDDCIILNDVNLAAAFSTGLSEQERLLARRAGWTMLCRISGYARCPEERIRIYSGYLRKAAAERGLEVRTAPTGPDGLAEAADARLRDCDRAETYWKLRRGAIREILFLAPPSRTAARTRLLLEKTAGGEADCVGVTVQPQVQGRAFRVECDLFHAASEAQRTRERAEAAERALLSAGAFFDRPYGALPELVYSMDPAATEALKRIKSVFDPGGIFNPGKLCF